MDEVLEMLDKTTKRIQQVFEENKKTASKQTAVYEKILLSKEASEAQKVKALIGKTFELDRLERLSAQLSLLYTLQILLDAQYESLKEIREKQNKDLQYIF